jgi:hypothetical protein
VVSSEERVAALVVLHEGAEGEPARRWFADQGFSTGPLVGISFSIEGSRSLMDEYFADFPTAEGPEKELGLERLPTDVRALVRAVVVEAPPDFGPTNP